MWLKAGLPLTSEDQAVERFLGTYPPHTITSIPTHQMVSPKIFKGFHLIPSHTCYGTLHSPPSVDCIEGGLPYSWERLNIDPQVESGIVRTLFEVTERGRRVTSTSSAPVESSSDPAKDYCVQEEAECDNFDPESTVSSTPMNLQPPCPHVLHDIGNVDHATARGVAAVAQEPSRSSITNDGGRWNTVRLKVVKDLAPPVADYWQIKAILARLKSGWTGYDLTGK